MKTSKSYLEKIFRNRQLVIDIAVWSVLIIGSLIILGILMGTKVLEWDWITSFILGALFSTLALYLIRISVKVLIRTENYYFYVFLFTCRIGLYFIPFLLAIYIPDNVFSIFGVLWGLIPLVVVPLSGMIPAMRDTFSRKNNKLLSQA